MLHGSIIVAVSTAAAPTIASVATASTVAAATTTASGSSRAGLVDGEPSPVVIATVEGLDRRQGLVIIVHLDETETPTASRVAIAQDLGRRHRAELLEQFLEMLGSDGVLEITDI